MTQAPAQHGSRAGSGYEAHKARVGEQQREQSRGGRDIGPIPPAKNPDRRAACERDFALFAGEYLAARFYKPWSANHRKIIARMEQVVLGSGRFALAMPRGSGKTSICEAAVLWAMLYAHRRYPVIVAAETGMAQRILDSIADELCDNAGLEADWPEVCRPLIALEGIHQRAHGQLCEGEPTRITRTAGRLILPTIRGSICSGLTLDAYGLTGAIRSAKRRLPGGEIMRPDIAVIDDPQTDDSARSPTQCETRERLIESAVLGLSGLTRGFGAIMPCTVIRRHDLADQMLDRRKHPEWAGERMRMLEQMPERLDLWDHYGELLKDGLAGDEPDRSAAEAFYRERRAEMDRGAVASWPESYKADEGEQSAIESAMRARAINPAFFASELQNEPLDDSPGADEQLDAQAIAERISGSARGVVPGNTAKLTAMIDVHANALVWTVIAWTRTFGGVVIDYGTHPEQPTRRYTLRAAPRKLADAHPGMSREAQIRAGLDALEARIVARDWPREDGGIERVARCLIDANWSQTSDVVYGYCQASRLGGVLLPSHGKFYGAGAKRIGQQRRRAGDRIGLDWKTTHGEGRRRIRHALFDSNRWKSRAASMLLAPPGDPSALLLYGEVADSARPDHRTFAEQVAAERRLRIETKGGEACDLWQLPRPGLDNHYGDCVVGCAVAASIEGIRPAQAADEAPAPGRAGGRKRGESVEAYRARIGAA